MKTRYTDTALLEVEGAVSYLLERNPSSAAAFADLIDAAVATVLDHPYSAEETEIRGVRRVYIRRFRYSLFYTVEGDEIVILHVRHAARRWPWEEEGQANR
jgi:plasmid stabilization system protein ParE